jgi:hypothetical protein
MTIDKGRKMVYLLPLSGSLKKIEKEVCNEGICRDYSPTDHSI